jgi:acetolactate synthase-1/2/3 large subunit
MKYSNYLAKNLKLKGYTHCMFVAGGNIMHLLDSSRSQFKMIPFVHEVGAAIACEYFNEFNFRNNIKDRAFVLVTAGPGITNALTGVAGSFLESRELLIIGGQVKKDDLKKNYQRQNGIQEIDGISISRKITKNSTRIIDPILGNDLDNLINESSCGRKGPVFLEIPLDVQAKKIINQPKRKKITSVYNKSNLNQHKNKVKKLIANSKRPILLLGGGVNTSQIKRFKSLSKSLSIPMQTTWNGITNVSSENNLFFGRPNTWGQRYANIIIQQADVIIAVGTGLGLQQTGFNHKLFGKKAKIIHVNIDKVELERNHPKKNIKVLEDGNKFISFLLANIKKNSNWSEWVDYCFEIKKHFPLIEKNVTGRKFVSPFNFINKLSKLLDKNDVFIPCSSGGAFTSSMQAFEQKEGQTIITNKGLASMGYGLSGAIGCSLANRNKRVILVEGDGGFAQNLQELGTVKINKLNLKIIIFYDNGYASIRMTQKSYFGGEYIGCDESSGLGMPDFKLLAQAYGLNYEKIKPADVKDSFKLIKILDKKGPSIIVVPIDPEQTYFPKITSRITKDGNMESNPIHLMSPEVDELSYNKFFKHV